MNVKRAVTGLLLAASWIVSVGFHLGFLFPMIFAIPNSLAIPIFILAMVGFGFIVISLTALTQGFLEGE
jgi:hypothetical protein